MSRIKNVQYWTDGRGRNHDITKMSNDYVINCIGFLQRRIQLLNEVEYDTQGYALEKEIAQYQQNIKMFVEELDRREEHGIMIERKDGCEEY